MRPKGIPDPRKIHLPKDELYQKYIIENLTYEECAEYFHVSRKVVVLRAAEYGFRKDTRRRYENICKKTKEHFGVEKSFASPEIIAKCRQTMIERYGVEYTAQSKELQDKMQKTMLEKYGKNYYVETGEFQEKLNKVCEEREGVKWPCQFKDCIKSLEDAVGHSQPERAFSALLDKYNIEYEQEYPLRGFKYDFKVGSFLFEINPTGTHNANFGLFGQEPKAKTYHYIKHSVAKDFCLRCVHIFDWDNSEKIIQLFLLEKEKIYARNCKIKEVSKKEAICFLQKYHLQGYANDENRLGLYYKDKLVSIMTFGKPRYNTKYEYELIRLCSSKNVVGGFEKLFNCFIKTYKPQSILSYCDLAKFDGKIYRTLGFKAINKPHPSCHWVNLKTGKHITDNLLRQKGFDQLFKTHYGKGISNKELMLANDFVQVYDCGQLTYVWIDENNKIPL